MRHLLSYTVYEDRSVLGDDARSTLDSVGADGLELLTSYDVPDPWYRWVTESVHLPYATDWMAAWEGRPYEMDDDYSRFYMFGRSREDVVANVTRAIECASVLDPAYGVFHAGDGELEGGEPPFPILFENLWWAGLRLLDDTDFRRLESRLEFDGWGICLDTGHMMNCLPGVDTEQDGIAALERIFSGYCSDLVDRVTTMHLHWSASWPYRSTFEERRPGGDLMAYISDAFGHISSIDQHMPFSDPACLRLVELLEPDFVTHEMPGSKVGMLEDFRQQRSLFP